MLLCHNNSPTTSISPETKNVLKEGASAETSQLYLPEVGFLIKTCVAFDSAICKYTSKIT